MAFPIKETPVLKGREARRFEKQVQKNESRPVPRKDYLRAQETYRELKRKSKIWL